MTIITIDDQVNEAVSVSHFLNAQEPAVKMLADSLQQKEIN